jgi:hypothetical protein
MGVWIAKMKCAAQFVDAACVLMIHFADYCILDRTEEKRKKAAKSTSG